MGEIKSALGFKKEIYISTDVEADGKIPGISSMLSFGSAAYTEDKTLVSTFSANLELLPNSTPDPETMKWWESQPEAWEYCRKDIVEPSVAMKKYHQWLGSFEMRPVFVGYPAAYDFMWVYWYLIRFVGRSPFAHSALDIKTLAMAMLGKPFRSVYKNSMPRRCSPHPQGVGRRNRAGGIVLQHVVGA